MEKLIINFCKQFEEKHIKDKDYSLIDLSNVCQRKNIKYSYNADTYLDIYSNIINQLYDCDSLINYEVCGYPLFHLTELSQKHSEDHWLIDFCKLLALVKLNKGLLKSFKILELNAPIIVKKNELFLKQYLNKYEIKNTVLFKYHGKLTKKKNIIIKTIIVVFKYLRYLFVKKKSKVKYEEYLFVSFEENGSQIFSALKKIFANYKINLELVNPNFWTKKNNKEKFNSFISPPSLKSTFIFKFFMETVAFLFLKKEEHKIKIERIELKSTFVVDEIYRTLSGCFNLELIICFNLLENYFSKSDRPLKIFYEDEFYISGKCISLSKNKSLNAHLINSYGIQHGHINQFQTLYTFYDNEIKTEYPSPDFFIIWGDFYEKILSKNGVSKLTTLLPLGSPVHLNIIQPIKKKIIVNKRIKYLWCLTDYNSFIDELKILKNSVLWNDAEIKIRQHPRHKFLNDSLISRLDIPKNMVLNNAYSLYEDINRADFILTTYYSTIIIDALINETVVIALSNNIYKNSLDGTGVPLCSSSKQIDYLFSKTSQSKVLSFQKNILANFIINDPSKIVKYFLDGVKEKK
jgi:hypothetical protein